MKITVDDLETFLKEHKDEIDYVYLQYTWGPKVFEKSASLEGIDRKGNLLSLYHRFSATAIDSEYSYAGDVEGAIRFAEDYACWNGREIDFENGIVFAQHKGEVWQSDEYPDDLEVDNTLDDLEIINVEYLGLFYYDRKKEARYYDGPIIRPKEDTEADE